MPMHRHPPATPPASESRSPVPVAELRTLHRAMLLARRIDARELALVQRGEAFFHVSGAGHEAVAGLALSLTAADWLLPHYRDKALLLARGVPPRAFFDGLLCRDESPSRGRQMSAHLGDPARHVVSMAGPVGNHALHAVGIAQAVRDRDGRPLVACLAGEGTTQQGEYLEAIAEAVRRKLPVLFVVEDNRWAISTPTGGATFASLPGGPAESYLGLAIERVDGRDPAAAALAFRGAVRRVRRERGPALVWMRCERLADHTNADDHRLYRPAETIEHAHATGDPLTRVERQLRDAGMSDRDLARVHAEVEAELAAAEAEALAGRDPTPAATALAPLPAELTDPAREFRGTPGGDRRTLRDALRDVLRHHLETDPRVTLAGQDIEDPKGDVFGVTAGLSTAFPGRVINATLSESTIVGTAIGRALAGERPVAFLQFADFLPLAFNQIASELGTMHWRTAGGANCPVIVLVTCGGYKPGLGPFHAQSPEATVCHVPGVDVVMPYTAADAAGLLNAAFASPRPTIVFYPKAALNLRDESTSADVSEQFVPIGRARRVRAGTDLTLVAWGNTVGVAQKAAAALAAAGVTTDLLDLRTLAPWDRAEVVLSAERTGRLLVVHESTLTCGLGGEVVATVAEHARVAVKCKRVARPDVPVPCHFGNQLALLPSFRSTLTAAAELLGLDLTWDEPPAPAADGRFHVTAIGSGPSDESVTVVRVLVKPGQRVAVGAPLAELEASKSTVEMVAPVAGVVEAVVVGVGDVVPVGQPVVVLKVDTPARAKPITEEPRSTPRLTRRASGVALAPRVHDASATTNVVGIGAIASALGSRAVGNDEILIYHPNRTSADVVRRTGIESRNWVGPAEDSLTLATAAARQALAAHGLTARDLDLIVCCTGSPPAMTPSLACRVLAELAGGGSTTAAAYDINAACAGYLYALQAAHDFLRSEPAGRVLVLTSEVLSSRLNLRDFDTAFLFGDAATATVVLGEAAAGDVRARLRRPTLSARGETGEVLSVPLAPGDGYIAMQGIPLYDEAVRSMGDVLGRACAKEGLAVTDLGVLVPHQANQRILDSVRVTTGVPVFSNIRRLGNTSSSSIPLALIDWLATLPRGPAGLVAFGGGFTFGAAVLDV